ncbi:MAG: hypothetical protein QNI97_13450 [Desulfobacterales bacterium]|nr:hypothetical protein [Desulfobacterales bacterium]MDJ0855869.1 hypothetical protein [Desulfobacterales bacterium]
MSAVASQRFSPAGMRPHLTGSVMRPAMRRLEAVPFRVADDAIAVGIDGFELASCSPEWGGWIVGSDAARL